MYTSTSLTSFRTSDIDVAIERISRMFGPHHIQPSGRGKKIQFEHSYAWLADICINQLAYGRELRNNISELHDDNYCVMFPLQGQYAIETSGKRVMADANSVTVINPTRPITLEASSDYSNVSVRITRKALDKVLVSHIGERSTEPVVFVRYPQSLQDGAQPLKSLVMQIWHDCQQEMALSSFAAAGRELEVLFASLLLLNIPNNYSDKLAKVRETTPSPECQATADFLKRNAAEDIYLEDIVKASGLAKTSLYTEFNKYYEMTPMEFLRKERLRLAYEMLASASSENVSVTNVALDCGFTHFSRFANYYKQHFGELPSQTLQRHRDKFQ